MSHKTVQEWPNTCFSSCYGYVTDFENAALSLQARNRKQSHGSNIYLSKNAISEAELSFKNKKMQILFQSRQGHLFMTTILAG